ncbi:MAG: DUF2203 domain-containing protein [Gemmatimonadales bacterium]|jgi:hypothetical protein
MPKYFTVEEANRTLPLVRRVVSDIVSTHRRLVDLAGEYRAQAADKDVSAVRRVEIERELSDLSETVNAFIRELTDIGVLFKGFENGLVDFYAKLDGRPIFLCWKLGEESVEWFHDLNAGYLGRQRLPLHLLDSE